MFCQRSARNQAGTRSWRGKMATEMHGGRVSRRCGGCKRQECRPSLVVPGRRQRRLQRLLADRDVEIICRSTLAGKLRICYRSVSTWSASSRYVATALWTAIASLPSRDQVSSLSSKPSATAEPPLPLFTAPTLSLILPDSSACSLASSA